MILTTKTQAKQIIERSNGNIGTLTRPNATAVTKALAENPNADVLIVPKG